MAICSSVVSPQKNNASHSSESSQLSIHWKQAVNLIPPFSFYKSPKFHGITDIDAEPGKHCEVGKKKVFFWLINIVY